jgi:hypothetical protein
MNTFTRSLATAGASGLLVVLAACGSSSGTSGSAGSSRLTITSPSDGANVGSSVKVAWTSADRLGPPSSGRNHVHVFVDGHSYDYTVVGGNSFTVTNLSPGEHTIQVTEQHADHTPAGPKAEVQVHVGGTGSTPSPSPTDTGMGGGYGSGY